MITPVFPIPLPTSHFPPHHTAQPHTSSTFIPSPFVAMTTGASQPTWQEVLGSKNWEGLLDPLDLDLRNLLLLCGDLIQATYDSFNNDQNSLYCGSCRYGKSSFFRKVQFPDPTRYDVVSYLYATAQLDVPEAFLLHSLSRDSWDRESNWIGYVAASSDQRAAATGRREIFVVWRGTTRYWN